MTSVLLAGTFDDQALDAGGRKVGKPLFGSFTVGSDGGEVQWRLPVQGQFLQQLAADVQGQLPEVPAGDGQQVKDGQ